MSRHQGDMHPPQHPVLTSAVGAALCAASLALVTRDAPARAIAAIALLAWLVALATALRRRRHPLTRAAWADFERQFWRYVQATQDRGVRRRRG